jgi:hypothetical protein
MVSKGDLASGLVLHLIVQVFVKKLWLRAQRPFVDAFMQIRKKIINSHCDGLLTWN